MAGDGTNQRETPQRSARQSNELRRTARPPRLPSRIFSLLPAWFLSLEALISAHIRRNGFVVLSLEAVNSYHIPDKGKEKVHARYVSGGHECISPYVAVATDGKKGCGDVETVAYEFDVGLCSCQRTGKGLFQPIYILFFTRVTCDTIIIYSFHCFLGISGAIIFFSL